MHGLECFEDRIRLAMRVLKPEKPGCILATTHGWPYVDSAV